MTLNPYDLPLMCSLDLENLLSLQRRWSLASQTLTHSHQLLRTLLTHPQDDDNVNNYTNDKSYLLSINCPPGIVLVITLNYHSGPITIRILQMREYRKYRDTEKGRQLVQKHRAENEHQVWSQSPGLNP